MKKGLIEFFAGNPVAATLLLLFLLIGGVVSGVNIPIQAFPEIDLRTVTVTVESPGASPTEVEEDIIRRLEESVVGLRGVDRVVGTAVEGHGLLQVEMEAFADPESVLADVQTAVYGLENFPPPNAEPPRVELERLEFEVMTLAVSSLEADENGLRSAAEQLRLDLLDLPAISQVELIGTRDREITIELSEEDLRRNGLTATDIARTIRQESLNLTAGEVRTDTGGVILHVTSKRRAGHEFEDIPVLTRLDGTIVTLGQVATVRDGFVDEDIRSELDGRPAVFVQVKTNQKQSFSEMSEQVRAELANYSPPMGITVEIWNDRLQPPIERLLEIVRNAIIGAILVFLLLVLVFDLRVAFWIAFGIPLSFIGSLIFFGAADLTLNLGTIFAFFLLVGIVVDDAVVVGESIATERESGKRGREAAIAGAKAVFGPITIGVLTTVLAFVPLLFISEGNYQIVNVFAWVALFVLGVSLIESFLILPAHLSSERPWSLPPLSNIQHRVRTWIEGVRDKIVVTAVSWSVRHLLLTPLFAFLLFIASLILLRTDAVRIVLFDQQTNLTSSVQADLHLPVGAPFEATVAAAERFVDAAHAANDQLGSNAIRSVSMIAGSLMAPRKLTIGAQNSSHRASVKIQLADQSVRTATPVEVERAWREHIGSTTYLESVEYITSRIRFRPAVAYAVQHDDPEILAAATADLRARLAETQGLYEITDTLPLGKRHLDIRLTPAGIAAGLTPAAVAMQLRANLHGVQVQRIQRGQEEIKVVVRYPRERRESLSELARERIHRPGGGEVPLFHVAELTERRETATLKRIDGRPSALVTARADTIATTPMRARRQINQEILPDLTAKYPGVRISADAGARDERAMLETLGILVPLVLLAMYALMAAFLRSYWKPIIAVAGIPISLSGAIVAHWVLGWDFRAMSIFGVVAVAGVVVNDALVLLDRYNVIRRENRMLPAIAVASAAARHRFRAVFLTSATTVLGLSPLLYERSDELVFLVPFVVSMLGGLVFAGIFTLLLLPTLVMIVEGRRE